MKKLLKILAITVGVLIALIIVLVIVALAVIDPNKYRDDIVSAVKTQTGREFKIEGDLKLSFFPWLGLETGGLELANAAGFGPEPFARVDSAAIKVELLPLLRKQVRVDGIRLNGLKLHLARAANGRSNWDDLTQKKPDAPKEPKEPKPDAPDAGAALGMFSVNQVEINKAEFTWRDQASGASYALRNVDLKSGNLLGSAPAPLKLSFDIESGKPPIRKRVQLDARLHLNPATQVLDAPELKLALGDLRINGQVRGTDVFGAPKLVGTVVIPAFAPRALMQEFGVAYAPADAKALTKLALMARLEHNAQVTSLPELRLTLDDTLLTGNLALQHQPRTSYRADLALDTIDIDRYLPPKPADAKAGDKPAPGAAEAVVIPLALLREVDADARLRIQNLKAFGIRSQQVVLKVAARDGRITLGPNEAKLYGGTYAGRTVLDASGKTPRFQFDEKLNGVQLGPFLKDAGVFAYFSGEAQIALALTAQGLSAPDIKKTLTGSTSVAVKDGAIEGFDLVKMETKAKELKDQPGGTAQNLASGLAALNPAKGDKTTFTKLQASATIANGVVSNKDLAIEAPHLRVTGSGIVNLVTDRYENYSLRVNGIPFILDGPLTSLPKLDTNTLLKEKGQQQVEKKKEEIKERAGDALRDRLKKLKR